MEWSGFFDDLESQLAAEWEREREALATEAERLRVAGLELRTRLEAAAAERPQVSVDTAASRVTGVLEIVGADWLGLTAERAFVAVPLAALCGVTLTQEHLLRSLLPVPSSPLVARLGFGFLCRDLARRRVGVFVADAGGQVRAGTIDRAGADHLDIAQHDPDDPRREASVQGYRTMPFSSVAWLRVEDMPRPAFM